MQLIKFKDFIQLQRGFDLPKNSRKDGPYPVIASTKIDSYHIEYKVDGEGVITGRSGALGEVQYFVGKYWPLNTTLWVKDFKGNHPKFVFYFLKTLNLSQYNSGAGVPTLNRNHLDELDILVPSTQSQIKIASILSSYDDLIENNNRRITILEEMARSLYREWFVKFRFPGHEEVKMVDSELGQIPEGWEVKKLHEISYLTMGQSPKSEFYNEDQDGLPFFQGVADFGGRFPSNRIYCNKATRFASKGDILFSVRAPVGRLNFAHEDLAIGRGLAAIQSNSGRQNFLFLQLKTIFYKDDVMGNGAIFNSVTKDDIQQIQILMPVSVILDLFESKVNAISKLLDNLYTKNNNLKSQRDMLLPKLISGKIKV